MSGFTVTITADHLENGLSWENPETGETVEWLPEHLSPFGMQLEVGDVFAWSTHAEGSVEITKAGD